MKLYYSAGSCSTSCHIILEESGLKYEAVGIDWDNLSDPHIAEVTKLNPLGTLPILITDEGKQLDQNIAIHTYVADKAPASKLLPPVGTIERAEAINWLAFVGTDLHKSIGALFGLGAISQDKPTQEIIRKYMVSRADECLAYMDSKLEGKDYLLGKNFSPADAYAFIVTGWTKWLDIPISQYNNIQAYLKRVAFRPAVAKVLHDEDLS